MDINFDSKKYAEQIEEQRKIKEKIDELENINNEIATNEHVIPTDISFQQEKIDEINKKMEEYSLFDKLFKRNKINELKSEIKESNDKIIQAKEELEKLLKKKEDTQKELDNLRQKVDPKIKIDLNVEDGILVIDDRNMSVVENENSSKNLLVHVTNYFPKNKKILCTYDGELSDFVPMKYDGEVKNVKLNSHRHTVHFVENSVVKSTGDGAGVWKQPKFVVISPKENYSDKILPNSSEYDTFTYGSVDLKGKPVMLVRKDAYGEIEKSEYDNYQIIKYDGDYQECVKNALKMFGIEPITAFDTGAHNWSVYMDQETELMKRDAIINFITDNRFSSKDSISLNQEELRKFVDMNLSTSAIYYTKDEEGIANREHHVNIASRYGSRQQKDFYGNINKKTGIPEDVATVLFFYGIKKDGEKYVFDSDEKVLDRIVKLRENRKDMSYEGLKEVYLDYEKQKEKDSLDVAQKNKSDSIKKEMQKKKELLKMKQGINNQKLEESENNFTLGFVNVLLASILIIVLVLLITIYLIK